jgi:hypothetical protein
LFLLLPVVIWGFFFFFGIDDMPQWMLCPAIPNSFFLFFLFFLDHQDNIEFSAGRRSPARRHGFPFPSSAGRHID